MAGLLRSLLLPITLLSLSAGAICTFGQAAPEFAFQIKVPKEDYAKALEAYDPERLDPQKVESSKFPAYGTIIDSVVAGSQAEEAGLKAGWWIVSVNGSEIWSHSQSFPSENGKRELVAISPQGEKKTFEFADRQVGVKQSNAHFPERWVLANIPRGKWDGDLLAATVAWNAGNHALAETSLRLAVNRGMPPNPVLTHYASLIALDRGNYGLARELNADLLKKFPNPKQIPRFYRNGLRTLGTSLGDFGLLKVASEEAEGYFPELQLDTAEEWRAWKAAAPRTSLLPVARAGAGPDLLSQCESVGLRWQGKGLIADFNPARDGTYIREVPPGRFNCLSFAPPVGLRDVIYTVRFGYREYAPPQPSGSRVTISLIDRQNQSEWASRANSLPMHKSVAIFRIWHSNSRDNWPRIAAGPSGTDYPNQCDVPVMTADEFDHFKKLVEANSPESKKITRHVNELSLIRIGGEAEIVLNGKSLLHAPVDPKVEDLLCLLQTEGMCIVVDGMTVKAIAPK